jgi:predicted porin
MKKSALALAALGAFAGAASAQSSVTLFGVVDLNVSYIKNDDASYSLGQDGMSSSRLGFRGIEDLGGGLKASFWLEGALGPDTGTGSSSYGSGNTAGPGALMFRRRSTLSLSNQWGELRLGRDYTPTFWNWTVFDPFGTNGIGAATNLGLSAQIRSVTGAGDAFGTLVRANNTVQYILPAGQFGPGLYGQVMVAAGENAALNKYWGGRIGYAAGPFDIAAAYGQTAVDAADTLDMDVWNIGGSWNLGAWGKISAFYNSISVDVPGGGNADQNNYYIGYAIPFGQWNFKASWGYVDQGGVQTFTSNEATQWAIGADYNLSKRTAIYATASWINNSAADAASGFLNGTAFTVGSTSPLTRGENSSGFQVGVRHSF